MVIDIYSKLIFYLEIKIQQKYSIIWYLFATTKNYFRNLLLQFLQNITHSAKISHSWQKLHIFSQKTTKYFHKKLYVRSTFCFYFLCQANIPEPSAQGWGRGGGRRTSSLTDSRRHTRRSRPCAWHSPPPACRLRPGLSGSGVNYRNMTLKLAKAILTKLAVDCLNS